MPVTYSNGTVTQSSPSDYAASQRSKERERESRYEQQRSNFFNGIFGGGGSGGGGSSGGNRDLSRTRPVLRGQQQPFTPSREAPPVAPEDKDLSFDLVPYYQSDKRMRPPGQTAQGPVQDNQTYRDRLRNFGSAMETDLRLGLGGLRNGVVGFADAIEDLGFGRFRGEDGQPAGVHPAIVQAYENFQTRSRKTAEDADKASMGDGDDNNFYGNYDPCPEGYRTDPVTGMCVPVMGMSYETAPAAPAQYQGNFVDSPFPDLAPRGPVLPMGGLPMSGYTQAMNYTSPNIAPSSMAAQGMGIAGIPMTPILG